MEDHGPKFCVTPSALVKRLGHYDAFECRTHAFALLFVALKALLVGLREDQQNLHGMVNLATHPFDPTLFGVLHVLVDPGVDSVSAQSVSQCQHALLVFLAVVTVTDKDPTCCPRRLIGS